MNSLLRRDLLKGLAAGSGAASLNALFACGSPDDAALGIASLGLTTATFRSPFAATSAPQYTFGGAVGQRLTANLRNWLVLAPKTDPAIPEMFSSPVWPLTAPGSGPGATVWMGEYAGKYLISAAQAYRITPDTELAASANLVVSALRTSQVQKNTGYLGPWAPPNRNTGSWDAWGQYHALLGLLRWYEATGSSTALTTLTAGAASLMSFGGTLAQTATAVANMLVDASGPACNLACAHLFALLARKFPGTPTYGQFALELFDRWRTRCALTPAQQYTELFYEFTANRWECLHDLQAVGELGYAYNLGGIDFPSFFEDVWQSILLNDVDASGGFSAGELATGNPYDWRATETCATVAWMALTIDALLLTGRVDAADALERSLYNAMLGAQSPDGSKWTYDTSVGGIVHAGRTFPGRRIPASAELFWQAIVPGGPSCSCCALNGPRGLGCLGEWAVLLADNTVVVNYYGPSTISVSVPNGPRVTLEQLTTYPSSGAVTLRVHPNVAETFTVKLRIPAWSAGTMVSVNGVPQANVTAGTYHSITRLWSDNDTIALSLNVTPRVVDGAASTRPGAQGSTAGKIAVYAGPLLMAYDSRYGTVAPNGAPRLYRSAVAAATAGQPSASTSVTPLRVVNVSTESGSLALCDFATAGLATRVAVTPALVTSGRWHFARLDGTSLVEGFQMLSSGAIVGSGSSNEASWTINGGALELRASNGAISSRLFATALENGNVTLQGPSLYTPTITHVLRQQSVQSMTSRTWQFRRADGTIIARRLRLEANGTISGFPGGSSPNETYWQVENGQLVFRSSANVVTTRFTSQRMRVGLRTLSGPMIQVPSIGHVLVELDDDVTTRFWDLWRVPATGGWQWIARVRLEPHGTVMRTDYALYDHERSWRRVGDAIELYGSDGIASSRFQLGGIDALPHELTLLSEPFRFDSSLRHALREVQKADWAPGTVHTSWFGAL